MRWITVTVALLLSCTSFLAVAQDGPFGLSWGATEAQVKALGVTLTPEDSSGSIRVYSATRLPKDLSIAEKYFLVFY